MNDRRPWLALVLALFCLPLFVGLGRGDVRDDEAIYSFAVDRVLETGDWLEPKSIPNEDWAFLEKPPLKFWIVAAPIAWGLLPHDEFGLRFWDALFGAVAFVYVFLIGVRLAGPICGAVAVLVLFGHGPLLFLHGLRSNNMEAPLFLAYCGGVYHFLVWAGRPWPATAGPGSRLHAYATGLFFVLGFMTKFVAVLFLPLVLAAALVVLPPHRRRLRAEWRLWGMVTIAVLVLVVPWFAWATTRYGAFLWTMMLRDHVYERFTGYLDPNHLEPWFFYFVTLYERLVDTGAAYLTAAGLAVLVTQTVRRRWLDGVVVLTWAVLPVVLVSAGTSKLYHYAYPFLPPLALAAGYLVALLVLVAPVPFGRAMASWHDVAAVRLPRLRAWCRIPIVRLGLLTVATLAVTVAALAIVFGSVEIVVDSREVFRSSGVFRPAVVAFTAGTLAGAIRGSSRAIVVLLVASLLPVPAYRRSLSALTADEHPMRSASDCLRAVQQSAPHLARGLYVDLPEAAVSHPLYYYMRRVRPWIRAPEASPGQLRTYLTGAEQRPILVWEPTYQEFWHRVEGESPGAKGLSPDMIVFEDILNDVFLLLPGPYRTCAADRVSSAP